MTGLRNIIFVLAALILSGVCWGQVVQQQTGEALDANYQLGSGGFNTVAGGVGGVNSQLIVTGQVTGLAAFHGAVPTEPTNQLRVRSVSESVDTFIRQSVGTRQVVTGTAYAPAPYFNRSTTVYGLPAIVSGQTLPGTNAPGANSAMNIQRVYADVVREYKDIVPLNTGKSPVSALNVADLVRSLPVSVVQPGNALSTGAYVSKDRQQLLDELAAMSLQGQLAANSLSNATSNEQYARPEDQLAQDQNLAVGQHITLGGTASPENAELANSTRGGRVGLPASGVDIYTDVLVGLQQQQQQGAGQPAAPQPPVPQRPGMVTPRPDETTEPLPPSMTESTRSGVVISSLGGRSDDLFNTYMNKGQASLRKGEYYNANREFETASLINSSNPLAKTGSSLALFAAGEPFTAAIQLRRAMEILPPLMTVKIDIKGMIKEADINQELRKLDSRIETQKEPVLLYLSTFIHYNLGQMNQAKESARKLKNVAGTDKLLESYADFVITGNPPTISSTRTTQPASTAPAPQG